jgi:hypothetical protein
MTGEADLRSLVKIVSTGNFSANPVIQGLLGERLHLFTLQPFGSR